MAKNKEANKWRNLGLIVLVVIIIAFAYVFILPSLFPKNIGGILEENEYSVESFSFSISSFINPLDVKLVEDLENFVGSEEDMAYVKKVLEIEEDKNALVEEYFLFLNKDYLTACDELHVSEENLSESALDVVDGSEELDAMSNTFGADVNVDNLLYQYENLLMSMSAAEENCLAMWEMGEYEYMEEEFEE